MGIIFSKIKQYLNAKVDDAKAAIRNKVENVKQGVRNRITGTRDAINSKVNQIITSCKNCVRSTKEDIIQSVGDFKDGIVGRVRGVKNGVCDKCFRIKCSILGRINCTKNSITSAKDRFIKRICHGRDNVVRTYVGVRSSIRDKYRGIRNAKLNRWQKAYYSVLAVLALCIAYVLVATAFNVYTNDYDQIEARFRAIWEGTKAAAELSREAGSSLALHAWKWTCFICRYVWRFSTLAWIHGSEFLGGVKSWLHDGSREVIHFLSRSLKEATILAWLCLREILCLAALGARVVLGCALEGGQVAADHLIYWAVFCSSHAYEGAKVALHLTIEGADLVRRHGGAALWEYGPRAADGLVYLATDFRRASVEAFLASKQLLAEGFLLTCLAIKSGSITACSSTLNLLVWTYDGGLALAETVATRSALAAEEILTTASGASLAMRDFLLLSYDSLSESAVAWYNWALLASGVLADRAAQLSGLALTGCIGLCEALYAFAMGPGLTAVQVLTDLLLRAVSALLFILFKFIGDLATLLFRFFRVTAERVYSVSYAVLGLSHVILTTVASLVRFVVVRCLVRATLGVFRATIWSLAFISSSYSAFLERYNEHREIVFFSFLALLLIYCSGLARDRRASALRLRQEEEERRKEEQDEEEQAKGNEPRLAEGDAALIQVTTTCAILDDTLPVLADDPEEEG